MDLKLDRHGLEETKKLVDSLKDRMHRREFGHWRDDPEILERLSEMLGALLDHAPPERPAYVEVVQLYFDAKRKLIAESSPHVREDTLRLWEQCRAWLAPDDPLLDHTGMVEFYRHAID